MPWTLYRSILADLLRIILLTTAILVTVIAFGAAIKPLANDRLLDAAQTAKYIGLVIVPMLQYALPFAAGFGATLAFHRMTADNEVQAMAASGLSYLRMLVPVFALGLALTVLMVVLTQAVIPRFWSMIAQTIAEDVTRLFQAAIRRGEAFQIGNMQVYADEIVIQENPEGPDGPATRMVLLNVAAADLDDDGRIVTDVTAWQAIVDVYRRDSQMYLKMVMNDTVASNAQTGQLVYSERFAPQRAIVVPMAASESLKALSISRMMELRRNPDSHGPVQRARESLADALRDAEVRQSLAQRLAVDGQLSFQDMTAVPRGSRTYVVNATRLSEGGRFVGPNGQPVEVVLQELGQPVLQMKSESVQITTPAAGQADVPTFDLLIGEHDVVNVQNPGGAVNRRAKLTLPSLSVAAQFDDTVRTLSSQQLLDSLATRTANRPLLESRAERLRHEIRRMHNEITARLMNRYALSVTAILLLTLGALMAMWHRGSLPLATYVWAFVPSIADLILISAGEQLLREGRVWAHGLMWSGNAVLLVMCMWTWMKVSRN